MASKPSKVPRWAATAPGTITGTISEPSEDKKTVGFVVREKPPSEFLDWLFYIIYTWLQYLADGALVGAHSIAGKLTVGGEALTFTSFTFTADSTTDQLAATANGLQTGDGPVRVSNSGGALPSGLASGTDYYWIFVDANHGKLATSRANAIAGTAIDLTTNGTGTQTLLPQGGTTRIEDVEVTRNLIVDGNAALTTASLTGLLSPAAGLTLGTGIVGPLLYNGTITPSALPDSNTNDYAPPNLATAVIVRLSGAPATTPILTGLTGGTDSRVLIVYNTSSTTLTIAHQNAASAPAHRFLLPTGANMSLAQDQSMTFQYDGAISRWRLIAKNF